jgi:hypothetical protein
VAGGDGGESWLRCAAPGVGWWRAGAVWRAWDGDGMADGGLPTLPPANFALHGNGMQHGTGRDGTGRGQPAGDDARMVVVLPLQMSGCTTGQH